MIDNGTLLARNFRQFDALGFFKTYWNNNSTVEDLLNYVKLKAESKSNKAQVLHCVLQELVNYYLHRLRSVIDLNHNNIHAKITRF